MAAHGLEHASYHETPLRDLLGPRKLSEYRGTLRVRKQVWGRVTRPTPREMSQTQARGFPGGLRKITEWLGSRPISLEFSH